MPREPVSGVDYNTHSDVQTCLNDIMNAVKGDAVRGSIHDAIALIDDRSVNLEQEIREEVADMVEPIVEDAISIICPKFKLSGDGGTCDIAAEDLYAAYQAGKTIAPSISYQGPTRYNLWCYNVTKSVEHDTIGIPVFCVRRYNNQCWLEIFTITWNHVSVAGGYITFAFNAYQLTGGGGSYTEGDGIDINNDKISVKLRSSNPGLAFDSNGNLYATGSGGGSYTAGDAIDITNNVISIGEPVYITMTEGANGIVDTSFIVSITEANFLAKFGIGAKDLMAILSGSYNVAKLGIKVYDDTSTSMDAYLDKIPILDIRYSKYDEELSLSEAATMIFIWDHCIYEFVINVEYSDEFRGIVSKINGYIAKTKVTSDGYGISGSGNSISVDTSVIQKKLTSTNAGTGISIANDAQGNPVISLDLPQAEGGGF